MRKGPSLTASPTQRFIPGAPLYLKRRMPRRRFRTLMRPRSPYAILEDANQLSVRMRVAAQHALAGLEQNLPDARNQARRRPPL
jgi:hypothetical protein